MAETDEPLGNEGEEEVLAATDRALLEVAWVDLRAAEVPATLWWAAWGEEEQRPVDQVPAENGLGTILVAPEHRQAALAALQAAEEGRVRRHLGNVPRDLRRGGIVLLAIALIFLTVLGLWRSGTTGMIATTGAFLLLLAWDVRAGRGSDDPA